MGFYDSLNKSNGFIDNKALSGGGIADYDVFTNKGGVATSDGIEKILQSISAILETPIGTRFFLPSFGSNVKSLLFEPNDFVLSDLLSYNIATALRKWETRITVLAVNVDAKDNEAKIYIKFKMNGQDAIYTYEDNFTRGVGK